MTGVSQRTEHFLTTYATNSVCSLDIIRTYYYYYYYYYYY
jgi:hypothetical protein